MIQEIESIYWVFFWIMVIFFNGLIYAFLTYRIAGLKGYGKNSAAWTGFLLGITGLIYYAAIPDIKIQHYLYNLDYMRREELGKSPTTVLPHCDYDLCKTCFRAINHGARFCRHCRASTSDEKQSSDQSKGNITCQSCSIYTPKDASFCEHCGHPIEPENKT